MYNGFIGIYSSLENINENLISQIKELNFYACIINKNNKNIIKDNVYYYTPEKINELNITLSYLIIIDDLTYFMNCSLNSKKIFFYIKSKNYLINFLENVKDNINEINEISEIDNINIKELIVNNKINYNISDYIVEFEDYVFIPNYDYVGNDVFNINIYEKPISEIKLIADNIEDCVCFNTWGYFKNKMENPIFLSNRFNIVDGLYIKKEFYNKI